MAAIFYIILILAALALYALLMYLLFHVAALVLAVGSVVMICVVLYNYVHTMWLVLVQSGGWQDSPDGAEPAYRQYYFRKAFQDHKQVIRQSWVPNKQAASWVIDAGSNLFTGMKGWFLWPLGLALLLIVVVGGAFAAVAYFIFGFVHLLLVGVCALVAVCVGLVLRSVEYLRMLWQRIFLVCPNSRCYQKISLPIYVCPNCAAEHQKLLPGTYGIIYRTCRCGTQLPTLFILGRSKVPSICPNKDCRRPLPSRAGTVRNLHIPIVGGPAAGKTSFLMANMCELQERAERNELRLTFMEKKYRLMFDKSRASFAQGLLLDKTAEESPDAFLFNFTDHNGRRGLLHIYDPAGELFQRMDVMRSHEYYEYTDGILFLLDPFSISRVQAGFARELASNGSWVKPSSERPQDVYDRMIAALDELSNGSGRFKNIPFAIVITKADAFNLALEIKSAGHAAQANGHNGDESSHPAKLESLAVRQWLIERGEGNLVRDIENNFKKIRYFFCSSLGRLPNGSRAPFTPVGVLDPLGWILSQYRLSVDGEGRTAPLAKDEETVAAPLRFAAKSSIHGKLILALWVVCTSGLIYAAATSNLIEIPTWRRAVDSPPPVSAPDPPPSSPLIGRFARTTTDLNLRSGAAPTYVKVGLAERYSRVRVLDVNVTNGWYQVEVVQHGRPKDDPRSADRGWVNSKFLTFE